MLGPGRALDLLASRRHDVRAAVSAARKIVLVSHGGYDVAHVAMLQSLIDRGALLFCAVGKDCELWEEVMDELVVGCDGESRSWMTTTSHPGESVEEVVEFATRWRLDEPSEVEIIEV
jgi:hypothetical protein